jgi:hypothetical protein
LMTQVFNNWSRIVITVIIGHQIKTCWITKRSLRKW